jgi:hypothetical protein
LTRLGETSPQPCISKGMDWLKDCTASLKADVLHSLCVAFVDFVIAIDSMSRAMNGLILRKVSQLTARRLRRHHFLVARCGPRATRTHLVTRLPQLTGFQLTRQFNHHNYFTTN